MQKEVFEQIKKESIMIAVLFVIMLLAFRIIFLSERFFVILRTVVAILWLLIIPGFIIMFYWSKELKFYERLIIGIGVGTVAIGILSYYLGLLGLNIKYHNVLLPLILIVVGVVINLRKIFLVD